MPTPRKQKQPHLSDAGKDALTTAIFLLGELRKQCLDVDWFEAAEGSFMLAQLIGVADEFSANIHRFPRVRITLEDDQT